MAGRATLQVSVEDSGALPRGARRRVAAVPGVHARSLAVVATAFTTGEPRES